jgi:serine/threonine protein kinase
MKVCEGIQHAHQKAIIHRDLKPANILVVEVASLTVGLYAANRERVLAQRRFQDVRELANKLFDIDVQARELPGSTKTRQLIVDTSLEYLRRLAADVRGDPGLSLESATLICAWHACRGCPSLRRSARWMKPRRI